MAHIVKAPSGWGDAVAPVSARAPFASSYPSYPATHEDAKGVKTLDPNAIAVFDLTWLAVTNPNPQTSIRVAAEFNLKRSGGGGFLNVLTQPVLVVGVAPGQVNADGDKPEQTLSGGEVVSGHMDVADIAGGDKVTLASELVVWRWKEEDYGLDCVLWWLDPATNAWTKLGATFHEWRIPWITLRKAAPVSAAVLAPTTPWPPSARFWMF